VHSVGISLQRVSLTQRPHVVLQPQKPSRSHADWLVWLQLGQKSWLSIQASASHSRARDRGMQPWPSHQPHAVD